MRGKGTAFPYDPPKYLVTTGVYRYVSNPMQIGIVLLMLGWGAILKSTYVMGTGMVAIMLFIAFKDVCNGSIISGRLGAGGRVSIIENVIRFVNWPYAD